MTSNKLIYWAPLFIAVLANICANTSLKLAMNAIPGEAAGRDGVLLLLRQPSLWIGLGCLAVVLVCYLLALRGIAVSVAYVVVTSLALVGLIALEARYFDMPLTVSKAVGAALVIAGVVLMARNA